MDVCVCVRVSQQPVKLWMLVLQFDVQILTAKLAEHWKYMIQKPKADLSTMVIAPMPGMVKAVTANVGDQVRISEVVIENRKSRFYVYILC